MNESKLEAKVESDVMSPQNQLFEYLRDMLYAPAKASLDSATMPEEYRELAEGLRLVARYLDETRAYGLALSAGDFSVKQPRGENAIAAPLKSVQSVLKHITWQMQQVAKGDYSQRVDFMGEFSDAFNEMVQRLESQHQKIEEEQRRIEQHNISLQHAQNLLVNLAFTMRRGMLIMRKDTGEMIFESPSMEEYTQKFPKTSERLVRALKNCPDCAEHHPVQWSVTVTAENELDGGEVNAFFDVQSQPVTWEGHSAIAHVTEDTTAFHNQQKQLENFALTDQLTGLANRRSGMLSLEQWYDARLQFCIAFVDIDSLKYCNDEFGHEHGDHYIMRVAKLLQRIDGDMMLCRFGGDEFMAAVKNRTEASMKKDLEALRDELLQDKDHGFSQSFSYGVCAYNANSDRTLNEVIHSADKNMYRYKVLHRMNREM